MLVETLPNEIGFSLSSDMDNTVETLNHCNSALSKIINKDNATDDGAIDLTWLPAVSEAEEDLAPYYNAVNAKVAVIKNRSTIFDNNGEPFDSITAKALNEFNKEAAKVENFNPKPPSNANDKEFLLASIYQLCLAVLLHVDLSKNKKCRITATAASIAAFWMTDVPKAFQSDTEFNV